MTKLRVLIFLTTLLVVCFLGFFISLYARGYRFNSKTFKFLPSGLLVAKSNPDGASIYINGERKGATNYNFSFAPGTYDIMIRKEGFRTWEKRLIIEKEVVTEIDANLFKLAPSLTAMTLTSVIAPLPSNDFTKIAYVVPATIENINQDKEGLWLIDTINLPIGFLREPKRITDGDLNEATWQWSPDDRQILLITKTGRFLLDAGSFTPQTQRVNIASKWEKISQDWNLEKEKKLKALMKNLPSEMVEILSNKATDIIFSPDETKVLYKTKADTTIPDNLVKPFPGASTQKQTRNIKIGNTYVYDIKEDRNFFIAKTSNLDGCKNVITPALLLACPASLSTGASTLSWFPTSRQLVLAEEAKIIIMDYDGTNRQEVYTGSYVSPDAFPVVSTDRLLILTNLGANSTPPNLYSLSLK